MSAIGGIADLKKGEICCDRLLGMSLAMKMRGRKRSSAYIGKEVAFIYNSSKNNAFGEDEDSQPAIFERAGRNTRSALIPKRTSALQSSRVTDLTE